MLLGLWAFLELPFWKGIAAFFLISISGHALGVFLFKRYATQDDLRKDLEARNKAEWNMDH
ncbi:MAG: hypothetical protein QNJ29_05940 [Rhizobiaceae bacterium]|nr:hypothetical protein [Rhizobiaceae bacterium]